MRGVLAFGLDLAACGAKAPPRPLEPDRPQTPARAGPRARTDPRCETPPSAPTTLEARSRRRSGRRAGPSA